MLINTDLHSHSGASGGVGDVSLATVAETMALKGIHIFGTGDALHDGWLEHLEKSLSEREDGLYALSGEDAPASAAAASTSTSSKSSKSTSGSKSATAFAPSAPGGARFLVQTEIILTAPVPCGGRKSVHTVILFPNFSAARACAKLCDRWGVKRNIGRPFLTCESAEQVAERLFALQAIDGLIEIIPAHVLTPQGIYGSDAPIERLADFFGEAEKLVHAVETGLSSDPWVLALIPELDRRALVSSSDCHCGALNRVGREYSTLDCAELSYPAVIAALRSRKVARTVEFTPAEGRYFLTGHRAGKKGHEDGQFCYFSPDTVPAGNTCPICGKELTVGVLQRALALSAIQGEKRTLATVKPRQSYVSVVPLVEAIAAGLGVIGCASKKVTGIYRKIIEQAGTEAKFWELDAESAERLVRDLGFAEAAKAAGMILRGEYTFSPLGFDGEYGELKLGEKADWFGQAVVSGAAAAKAQKALF